MPEMDEQVDLGEQVQIQIARPVTGISADDDPDPRGIEGAGDACGLPFEPFGKLQGDPARIAFPDLPDQVRNSFR
jgi:hypothetical protein